MAPHHQVSVVVGVRLATYGLIVCDGDTVGYLDISTALSGQVDCRTDSADISKQRESVTVTATTEIAGFFARRSNVVL